MARRARQISLKECYDILHLQKGADLQAVKTAYRKRAFELHPDLHPGDMEASRQFQILNEAYVALSAMLKPQEEAKKRKESAKSGEAEARGTGGAAAQEDRAEKDSEKAQRAYAEQDVLRDLLNDPFARRVFEDIYSQVGKQNEAKSQQASSSARNSPPPGPEKPAKGARQKEAVEIPQKKGKVLPLADKPLDMGVMGVALGWLRKQIDEKQTLILPAAGLGPGRKIRLQIRRGLSDELTSVEVTLPSDFQPGKPVRLRGLGKRVGPWQGDLYLTINTL